MFANTSVQSVTASSDKSAVVSCGTPENIATGFYAVPIQANQVGIATITANVTYTGGATETVSIEIYVVMEDGVYTIKSNATHLPTNLGDFYLNVQLPHAAVPADDWKSIFNRWYNAAIRADMPVGEEDESGFYDEYYDLNSSIVKKQADIHGEY